MIQNAWQTETIEVKRKKRASCVYIFGYVLFQINNFAIKINTPHTLGGRPDAQKMFFWFCQHIFASVQFVASPSMPIFFLNRSDLYWNWNSNYTIMGNDKDWMEFLTANRFTCRDLFSGIFLPFKVQKVCVCSMFTMRRAIVAIEGWYFIDGNQRKIRIENWWCAWVRS